MAKLHHALNSSGTAAVAQAVSGLGGIGKTALAIAYAHQYGAEYDYRLFCSADSLASLKAGYRAIASELALPVPDDAPADVVVDTVKQWVVVDTVKQWLETTPNYLLILDNADFGETLSVMDLATFLPAPPSAHILLTTRAQSLNRSLNITTDHVLKLDVMDADEAEIFLTEPVRRQGITLNEDEATAATELAKELGYLALALEQAAAYIGQPGQKFARYLTLYRKRTLIMLGRAKPETGGYEETVATTWLINFKELERTSPASADLLRLCAYLAPNAIPIEAVLAMAGGVVASIATFFGDVGDEILDEDSYYRLLKPLTDYSLVTVDASKGTFDIHRLVQAVTRSALEPDAATLWLSHALTVLNAVFPRPDFEHWQLCSRLSSHVQALLDHLHISGSQGTTQSAVSLFNRTGRYLYFQSLLSSAEILHTEARNLAKQASETSHENNADIADSLNNLAGVYQAMGRLQDARQLFVEALEIRRTILPENIHDIIISLDSLAYIYQRQDCPEDAERYFIEALEMAKTASPPQPDLIITCLNGLGYLYKRIGKLEESVPLLEDACKRARPESGPGNLITASCLNSLAELYQDQNRLTEALPLFEETLIIRRIALRSKHPLIAQSLYNLATVFKSLNRQSEARTMYEEALAIVVEEVSREIILSESSPRVHPEVQRIVRELKNLGA